VVSSAAPNVAATMPMIAADSFRGMTGALAWWNSSD
jgi:hypothetical protein